MKIDLMQLKLEGTDIVITCRKLPALGIAKQLALPYTDEGKLDGSRLQTVFYAMLPIIAVEPSKLEELNYGQLTKLIQTPEFVQYFKDTMGFNPEELEAKNA